MTGSCKIEFDFGTQAFNGVCTVAVAATGVRGRFKFLLIEMVFIQAVLLMLVGGNGGMMALEVGQGHVDALEVTNIGLFERVHEDRHIDGAGENAFTAAVSRGSLDRRQGVVEGSGIAVVSLAVAQFKGWRVHNRLDRSSLVTRTTEFTHTPTVAIEKTSVVLMNCKYCSETKRTLHLDALAL